MHFFFFTHTHKLINNYDNKLASEFSTTFIPEIVNILYIT